MGKAASNNLLLIFVAKNDCGRNRLGISVSKKTANKAVWRNKMRRRVKEAYMRIESNILQGYDIVVVPRAGIHSAGFDKIVSSLSHLFKRQGLHR